MWTIAFIIAAILLIFATVGCVWLQADRRSVMRDRDRLRQSLVESEQCGRSMNQKLHQLETEIALFQQKQEHFDQRAAELKNQFEQAQKQARETFQSLASDVLNKSNQQFLQLARKTFEGEQKQAASELDKKQQAIKVLVDPIREKLDSFSKSTQEIEKARREADGALKQQLAGLLDDQRRLRAETGNLVKALRRPEARGRWGEMQLKRVAELAGMIENCDFFEQDTLQTETGLLRPDMVIKLPGDRSIIVDAKTSFDAFINAVEAADEEQRQRYLDQHVIQIETQVRNLSKKEYAAQFDRSPDFVVMFIPGESFLSAAVQRKSDLIENAMSRGVVIATPTTLVTLLKAVAIGWREQQVTQNAKRISQLGQELHERIATATTHLERLGKNLEDAVKTYNQFLGSFESRIITTARKFKELGADSAKELPAEGAPPQIEILPRQVKSGIDL